uniref:Uncharacterized protein n=1 Tax=Brassica oleracea TaxID=3712 RepID=A0A3P6EXC6_BRAOL|nr:unnamed protein product [Brassica oleracea]
MVKMKSQRVEIKVICQGFDQRLVWSFNGIRIQESQEDKILLLVDKDRYRIHGFYKNISVVNRPNTRCVSAVSILLRYEVSMVAESSEFWFDDKSPSLLFTGFPSSSYYSKKCGFKLELHTSDRFKCNSDVGCCLRYRPPRLKPLLWVRSMPSSNRNPFR